MGTSASSNGPGGGVPFDPPWLDDIASPQSGDEILPDDQGIGNPGSNPPEHAPLPPISPPELAPPRRFYGARRELGDFARTGRKNSFQKAVGHYSRTGMGGASNAAKRMRMSSKTAANLAGVLQSAREGANPAINEWVRSLTEGNVNPQDVVDEIIRRIAPDGGSQDEASCRDSMAQAMGDLLERDPNIDLLHLEDANIWTLIESFLAYEAFNRLCLDIGQVFENSALSPRDRVVRMNEMQDYLEAEIYMQIEKLRQTKPKVASNQLEVLLQNALKNTFLVYED